MFGDLMGDFQSKQKEIQDRLKDIKVEEASEENHVQVTVNGNKEVLNIALSVSILEDKEQLEDLLLITLNRALKKAEEKAGEITQSQIKEMLPPGFDNLFG